VGFALIVVKKETVENRGVIPVCGKDIGGRWNYTRCIVENVTN